MTLATACTHCGTAFRVRPEQLRHRSGLVRCGRCGQVFDGLERLQSLDLAPSPPVDPARGVATPAPGERPPAPDAGARLPPLAPDVPKPSVHDEAHARLRDRAPSLLAVALAAIALLQGAIVTRDRLAAWQPALRPALEALVAPVGLDVRLPRELAPLTLEGFGLRRGDAPERLVLTATLRNAAGWPVRWPALELSLNDAQENTLARRVFLPAEWVGTARAEAGVPAHSEQPIRLEIEADGLEPAGFAASIFHP